MISPKFTDFLIESNSEGWVINPASLDATLNMLGAALVTADGTSYLKDGDYYVLRVFGDPSFVKYACEHQGYCKIIGERTASASSPEIEALTQSVDYVYQHVAQEFAARIDSIFASEGTLKGCFSKHYKTLPFERTNYWSGILFQEMDEVWRQHGPDKLAGLTSHDRWAILDLLADYLDFNLYSQVALNLQDWSKVSYQGGDSEAELTKLAKKWEKFTATPLSPGAKMVQNAFRPIDIEFNKDLSTVKSLKTITVVTQGISFRVSPKGSTPAFADSQNFSTIGIGGDQYVRPAPGHTVWYVAWRVDATPNILTPDPLSGGFRTPSIDYTFFSKSGGQILNGALFSRGIAFSFWTGLGVGTVCLPRMNSVMVVTSKDEKAVRDVFCSLEEYPMLGLYKDKRSFDENV